MNINWQDMIDSVLDDFDFEKIQKMMRAVNWTYAIPNEVPNEVPDVPVLRKTARTLLRGAVKEFVPLMDSQGSFGVSSGGFEATAFCDEDGEHGVMLKFVAEEQYSN
jgi:hypothetical protein